MKQKSHLDFNIIDVWCEADVHFGVIGTVSAVPDSDVHVNLVSCIRFDQYAAEENQSSQLGCDVHVSPQERRRALQGPESS